MKWTSQSPRAGSRLRSPDTHARTQAHTDTYTHAHVQAHTDRAHDKRSLLRGGRRACGDHFTCAYFYTPLRWQQQHTHSHANIYVCKLYVCICICVFSGTFGTCATFDSMGAAGIGKIIFTYFTFLFLCTFLYWLPLTADACSFPLLNFYFYVFARFA